MCENPHCLPFPLPDFRGGLPELEWMTAQKRLKAVLAKLTWT